VAGVSVQVRNLSVKFDASKERSLTAMTTAKSRLWPGKREVAIKTIIDDISADMPIGSLTGVISNSGSGKTTLLDGMSRRIPGSNLDITGSVTYNGKTGLVRTGTAGGSTSVAYVMQQDVLLPTLTVRETLQYAAGLRMPSPATSTERLQAVEDAIMQGSTLTSPPASRITPCADINLRYFDSGLLKICAHDDITMTL
jgi:ABC-type multidrug transport system ATPase subunit